MATFQVQGINEYAEMLVKISDKAEGMIKRAVWEGAKVIADNVKSAIAGLPEIPDYYVPKPYQPIKGVTSEEKAGMISGLGLAKMTSSGGFINTKLGFTGYVTKKKKTYPTILIARSVQSGSSFRRKIPFITQAVNTSKSTAESAMAARFDADMTKEI